MKKSFLVIGVALLATTVSCNLFNGILDNPLGGATINVGTATDVPSTRFVGLNDSQYTKTSTIGDLIIEKEGTQIKSELTLNEGVATPLSGKSVISGEDLPEISKPTFGSSENAGMLIVVNNPVFQDVVFNGTIAFDGQSISIPPVTLPGNKASVIFVGKSTEGVPTSVTPDQVVALSGFEMAGKEFKEASLDKITITPIGTKGACTKALSGEFVINTKYCAGLSFPAGTKMNIHRTFSDLSINLETYIFTEYDVFLTVTNPLPFDVEIAAANDKVSAVSKEAIAAGTPENPVSSQTTVRIKKDSDATEVTNADLLLKLTAASNGAKIPSEAKVKIAVEKIVVVK